MNWFKSNWKSVLKVVAIGVATLTADHTVAHKVSDFIVGWLPTIPF